MIAVPERSTLRNESSINCHRVPPAGAAYSFRRPRVAPLRPAAKRTPVSSLGGTCGGAVVGFDRLAGRVGAAVSEVARMWGANVMTGSSEVRSPLGCEMRRKWAGSFPGYTRHRFAEVIGLDLRVPGVFFWIQLARMFGFRARRKVPRDGTATERRR